MTRWRRLGSALCGGAAGAALAAMMLLTVADVALRALGVMPIRGVYELVELLLAATFFLALPAVFLRDEHIAVDVVDRVAPAWAPRLARAGAGLAVVVLAAMAWQGWRAAGDAVAFGDMTAELGLPRVLHWSLLLAGVVAAAAAALGTAARRRGAR